MGHREELLAAAKRCLRERGLAHITARDLVAESGTNLASIGYHFGSKEMLLNLALLEMSGDWGDELEPILRAANDPMDEPDPFVRFENVWSGVIEKMQDREFWGNAGFESLLTQARRSPELNAQVADGFEEARNNLGMLYHGEDTATENTSTNRALGGLYLSLVLGLTIQWVIDPDRAPTGADLATAFRTLVGAHDGSPEADSDA
ncbi:TetR/AcrR family transcriptional regulator [Spiractinospora alimapuensis]|uniref:TetR/AcrR family transcriptional regulator n=1 Tax=Spiractinospora alimapuensis TaxID=2820884 RepID=UPI001F2FCE65|nr:TetR/AcrR family transcriptional regulator [Spiractinospora alimapuensis]QVQ50226.1 TetR/AcrR family transcriptional regulator [Spiractinospora alimapuensis]